MKMNINFSHTRLFAKDNVGYLIALITIIIGMVATFLAIPFNIDSIFDEGYHYLYLQEAINGKIDGSSQWATLITAVLPLSICTSVLSLRIMAWCIPFLTVFFFFLITHKVATSYKEKVIYLILMLILVFPSLRGIILCYNEISQFLLILSCATLYRLCYDTNKRINCVWALLTGALITIAFFSILPSAVILGGCTVVLVLVRYWKQWKELGLYILCGFIGIGVALASVHFFVADLSVIYENMQITAKTITTVSRGYDPISFIIKICFFIRDFILCAFVIIGAYITSRVISRWYRLVGSLFFIISILVYSHYQVKPMVTIGMLMALLWIMPLINRTYSEEKIKLIEQINFDTIFKLFLICYPLLATIGTNLYIGEKMLHFLIPWSLLLMLIGYPKCDSLIRNSGLVVISVLLLYSFYARFQSIDYSKKQVVSGGFSGLYMSLAQEEHFTKVDSILSQYDFKRNESIVYATQMSMVTLSYIEGVPCGVFFMPTDFVAHASEVDKKPDFLFMCAYDEEVAVETMRIKDWGWPEEFDKYEVGTPETMDVGYSTERCLYCRKCLKK